MKQIRRKRLPAALAVAFGAGALAVASFASAQQAQRVEKIEVTGTNIKRTDTETPSVVQVITREEIERSGATTVAELLRQLPATGGGAANDFMGAASFQSGNQTVSLRGLGSIATLVLLNGRRIAQAPFTDPNTAQGASYNLNTIPVSAIERIDVLKDGASAIYGSDAIAGVVNIILRKDYRGAEVAWNHWQQLDHFGDQNYRSEQLSGTIGFGDLTRDRYNVLLSGEYFKRFRQPIKESGSGVANDDYRRLGNRLAVLNESSPFRNIRRQTASGNVFGAAGRLPGDPRCPENLRFPVASSALNASAPYVCVFDVWENAELGGDFERGGMLGRLTYQLTPNITAFAEASFTRTESVFTAAPPSLTSNIATWFSQSNQRFAYQLILPVGHPDNPNNFPVGVFYRFTDLGTSITKNTIDMPRVVAGLSGAFGAWDWETAILWTQNDRKESSNGILHFPTLLAAINNGTYRFFGNAVNSPELLAQLNPGYQNTAKTALTSWDLRGSREVFSLRGGPVMLAAGVEARKEELESVSDPRITRGEFVQLASTSIDAKRDVWSVFAELSVPVMRNLELQVAGRHDRYSDFGNATTPKVGLKWNAHSTLALRGTYAEGFRAPSLYQSTTGDVQAFNAGIVDPLRCPNGVNNLPAGAETQDCARGIATIIRANPNVGPEDAYSNTVGLIWAPTSTFSLSVDRWYVKRDKFIDRPSSPFVIQQNFLGNPAFADAVLRDPNPGSWLVGVPNSGPILSTVRRFDNFGAQISQGWDLSLSSKWALGAWGRLKVDYNSTYLEKAIWQFTRGEAYINAAGNFWGLFETPRYRSVLTGVWDYGAWSFLARHNFTSGWDYGQPAATVGGQTVHAPFQCFLGPTSLTLAFLGECRVSSWETIDLGVSWSGIRNLKVGVLVRNIMNRAAPLDPANLTLGFTPAFHNPYGRYGQLSVSYKFR